MESNLDVRQLLLRLIANGQTAGKALIVVTSLGCVVLGSVLYQRQSRPELPTIATLASAAPPQRRFEGRIVGLPYRPLAHNSMSVAAALTANDAQSLAFFALHKRVVSAAKSSPAEHHLVGVSRLMAGASTAAVEALERSLVTATGVRDVQRAADISTDYALLTNLSTAYLERGAAQGRASDYIRALKCADRAWRLRQTPETQWNRAVSLQRLYLNDDARESWQSYLAIDPSSEWSGEARKRLRKTEASAESKLWLRDGARLLDLPDSQVVRLALLFPLQVRKAVEKEILPAWATAVLSGDRDRAATCLQKLAVIGTTLERRSGEALLSDVSSRLQASAGDPVASAGVARTVMAIADAKKAYDKGNGLECRNGLRAVIPDLLRSQSPLVHYARFYVASSYYFDNDYASLRREAARLGDIPTRYRALHAQTRWILGLGEMSVGKPDQALQHYQAALAAFRSLGESDYVAAVHNLLAEAYDYLDSPDDAWMHRERALELVSRVGPSSTQWVQLLHGSAQLLLASQEPAVAKILLDRTLKLPAALADPLFFADTISWQAVALHQLGRGAEAETAWKQAAIVANGIPAAGVRDRALNNVTLTRALTVERGVTTADMEKAVAFARSSRNRWALPRLLRLQADVLAQQGAYADAIRGYVATIDEILDQRRKTSLMRYELLNRVSLIDVTERATSLAIRRGDHDAAFLVSEQSAGAAFRDAELAALPSVPANVAIIKIVCLPDRMVVWTMTARGVSTRQVSIPLDAVRAASDDMAEGSTARSAYRLGRMIVSPELLGPGIDTLVIVPDAAVATVHFGALIDPATGKPLLERYVVAESHTVAGYLRSAANPDVPAAAPPLLVEGAESDDLPRLQAATREINALQRLYPSAGVWRADAHPAAALPAALEKAGLIHFAAHAVVDRTNERLSSIVLGEGNKVLYAHEVEALRLTHRPIVVLSVCSGAATAGSRRRRAPTLADAFLTAGASAVIASSEPIEDAHARHFSLLLHDRLSRGVQVGRAVREIQLKFAREGRPWSDLVIVGNPAATFTLGPKAAVPLQGG
ncbi:MAG TPA: CHAT domain-containing protein [Thermoanaerobaculia bacterium]|nr:CHAT domain-containing protein [Thermoanaerobaculia bacterium]